MKKFKTLVALPVIIAGFAFAPNASAAVVNMTVVDGPNMIETGDQYGQNWYNTQVTFAGENGWHPSVNCTTSNVLGASGNTWVSELKNNFYEDGVTPVAYEKSTSFSKVAPDQVRVTWKDRNDNFTPIYVTNATVSCPMTKVTTTVKITHPLVWKTFTVHRSGVNTTSRSHSGSCYTNGYGGELHLDCWGGTYAQANYHFALPRDARNIHRSISTRAGCCNDLSGYTRKYWSGNTAIVRTTGWHGVYVRGVTVSYQHRVRTTKRTTVPVTLHATGVGQF